MLYHTCIIRYYNQTKHIASCKMYHQQNRFYINRMINKILYNISAFIQDFSLHSLSEFMECMSRRIYVNNTALNFFLRIHFVRKMTPPVARSNPTALIPMYKYVIASADFLDCELLPCCLIAFVVLEP